MNKLSFIAALITAPMLTPASLVFAEVCSKKSPAHTVALMELYTSEGCSSCPPADKFVSGMHLGGAGSTAPATLSGLSLDQVVPLSLHVDYWDYIGWKDSFANHTFTERQKQLSTYAGSHTIYTPEVFVAGKELRDWQGDLPAAVKRINARPARADIGIRLGRLSGGSVPVEVKANAVQGSKLYVALYQNDLVTEVKNGENRGVQLKHDYVVRDWVGPIPLLADVKGSDNGKAILSKSFLVSSMTGMQHLGIAAFVQTDKGDVLQALALPLCGG
ncbi:MAG: DUF1223 domain-containing protein [Burkholderiaceae bacterium]